MPWSRRGSEHLKISSNCLVTKCGKKESRDTGHLCTYWGRGVFNVLIIKYCQIFLVRDVSVHTYSSADFFSEHKMLFR